MEELLQILKVEDIIIRNNLKSIGKKDPSLVKTIKKFVKKEKNLSKIIKEGAHKHIFNKHNLRDVLAFGLHNYTKKTVKIGKHRSCYEKLVEEGQKFPWIDLVGNYKGEIFEPKNKNAWKKAGKLQIGSTLELYGKSIDDQHKKDVKIALDSITKKIGKEIGIKDKYVYFGPHKIRRMIVGDEGGIHLRTSSQIYQTYLDFGKINGQIRMIYGESEVDISSPITILLHGIEKGDEVIFEFYGKDFQKYYEKIAKALKSPFYRKNEQQ